jgi:aryl-phospho-beta-D-glucosidase BglC (GH1 family)
MASTPGSIDTAIRSTWSTGFVVDLSFTPEEAVNGWRIELSFEGDIVNLWNARIVSHVGNTYVLESLGYNASLAAGQAVSFGFQASGTDTSIDFDLDPPSPPEPVVLVAPDVATPEGEGATSGEGRPSLLGPLSTVGNTIVNAAGEVVTIEAVNWFGMESSTLVPHGLWARNWQDMMDEMKALGFNAIRLPFSLEAIVRGEELPNSINFGLNPDLQGLSVLEVLDRILDYAETLDMGVLLDNHRSASGPGPNGNGLWYDGGYTEADWISVWETLATRYGDHPAVIGADLNNEPHGATWEAWAAAAERAGNAVLEIAPDWLVVVEGVGQYGGDPYWWGGDLEGVRDRPVVLATPGKLVYSPHDYPASIFPQSWFFDGSDLSDVFRENWGYIHEEGIAPVLLGEFGSKLLTEVDQRWAEAITAYLAGDFDGDGAVNPGARPISFAWWSWNPNSGDTGGVLADDWTTPRQAVLDLLADLLDEDGTATPQNRLVFTVALAEPSTAPVTVRYATADGTATAGSDYVATSGTLTFAPGETVKTVAVTVIGDTVAEGNETVFLDLTGPDGTVRATGTITNDDSGTPPPPPPPPPPTVSVADAVVDEEAGTARLVLTLSAPAAGEVTVDWATRDGTARAGTDYEAAEGRATFAPGATTAEVVVSLRDDAAPEPLERFDVVLSDPLGAVIGDGTGTVSVRDTDVAPPPPPPPPPGDLTVSARIVNDWGSGAQVAITLANEGPFAVTGWELGFNAPAPITQLWGGTLTGTSGEVEVDNLSWNARINPGGSVEIGFLTGSGGIDLAAWLAVADFELT